MLQQTQVNRTIEKYKQFIAKYPTVESLAKSSKAELLGIWSGLGYNRRALWLQEAAQQIVEKGFFPKTVKELQELKGIGPYTSRAILIFAFNKNHPTVDTNIRRILIAEGFAKKETPEKELFKIAKQLLPEGRARDWHNALMDYGSMVATASKTGIKPTSTQPKFKGSKREYRGRIVKYLTRTTEASIEQIKTECKIPKKKLQSVIASLLRDGLIVKEKEKDKYRLPK
jgi:A/G-specific adenine glycosylase